MVSITNTARILVVDDNVLNLRVAARLLRELGHHGALATDGHKALQLMQMQPFDVVLLDVNMPGGPSGLDTLRAIRERFGRIQSVLMVSGQDDERTRRYFVDEGADGFLAKPLTPEMLATALAQATRRQPC